MFVFSGVKYVLKVTLYFLREMETMHPYIFHDLVIKIKFIVDDVVISIFATTKEKSYTLNIAQ